MKDGLWRSLVTEDIDIQNLVELIDHEFELQKKIIERLEFLYYIVTASGNKKQNILSNNKIIFAKFVQAPLQLDKHDLQEISILKIFTQMFNGKEAMRLKKISLATLPPCWRQWRE